MSIDAMTSLAIDRKFQRPVVGFVSSGAPFKLDLERTQLFPIGADQPLRLGADQAFQVVAPPPGGSTSLAQSANGSALSSIVSYIPTEIVVTYVAILASLGNASSRSHTEDWVVFWVFLAFTPLVTWTIWPDPVS